MKTEDIYLCPLCDSQGEIAYNHFRNVLFKRDGDFQLSRCTNPKCKSLWLSRRVIQEDVHLAYDVYPTHAVPQQIREDKGLVARFRDLLTAGVLQTRYGYKCGFSPWMKLIDLISNIWPGGPDELAARCFYLKAEERGRILEIGCGNGEHLLFLRKLGWEVAGVEIDSRAAEQARSAGIRVIVDSIEEFNTSDKFDVIILHHVIEHIYNPHLAISRLGGFLAQGGKLVILTPNAHSKGQEIYGENWFPLDPPRHVILFTERSLRILVENCGFETVHSFTSPKDSLSYYIFSSQIKAKGYTSMKRRESLRHMIIGLIQAFRERFTQRDYNGAELVIKAKKNGTA